MNTIHTKKNEYIYYKGFVLSKAFSKLRKVCAKFL